MDTEVSKESTLLFERSSSNVTGSFSGFTSLDVEQTICNRLEGAFFNTKPEKTVTTVEFHIPAVFYCFLDILCKEYIGQTDTDKDVLTVTSHFHKKTVHLHVSKHDRTLKISGPGQKLWFELHFLKRIALNLYKSLFNDPQRNDLGHSADGISPTTSTPTVPHAESRMRPVPVSPVIPASPVVHSQPPGQQITAIMDMIHFHSQQITTLQNQLISLCNEVTKLKEQQVTRSKPAYAEAVTAKDSSSTQTDDNTTQPPSNLNVTVEETKSPKGLEKKSKTPKSPKSTPSLPKEKRSAEKSTSEKRNRKKTLIIGDSLVKGISEKGLHEGVHCLGISGAMVDTVSEKIKMFDLSQFATVVISVGGNNASNQTDPEYFQEKLDQLVSFIKEKNNSCEIILCSICARSDCDVTYFNDVILSLALDLSVKSVNMDNYFNGKDQNQVSRYFATDGIHLSPSGVRRFLDAIEKSCKLQLVANFNRCTYVHYQRQKSPNYSGQTLGQNKTRCTKCGETNHSTIKCRHRLKLRCYGCGSLGHKQSKCHRV